MKILFVADPLESFKIYKDTTFSMMREAQKRGHHIVACEMTDVRWQQGEAVSAQVREIRLTGDAETDHEIEHLSAGFEDVVRRRQIPYVDCFKPLREHDGWQQETSSHQRGLPGQVGYGLVAWLVLNRGWFEWLGLTEPQDQS